MSWLDFIFRPKKTARSADAARERLQVIFAHEKAKQSNPDYLPQMQREIMEVIAKYVKIDPDLVKVEFEQQAERSILELNVTLPEDAEEIAEKPKAKTANKTTTTKKKTAKPSTA